MLYTCIKVYGLVTPVDLASENAHVLDKWAHKKPQKNCDNWNPEICKWFIGSFCIYLMSCDAGLLSNMFSPYFCTKSYGFILGGGGTANHHIAVKPSIREIVSLYIQAQTSIHNLIEVCDTRDDKPPKLTSDRMMECQFASDENRQLR